MSDWKKHLAGDEIIARLLQPDRLYTADETAVRDGAPRQAGIYAWYFDAIPAGVDASQCHRHAGWTLLYCGISPKKPPTNGRPPSRLHINL